MDTSDTRFTSMKPPRDVGTIDRAGAMASIDRAAEPLRPLPPGMPWHFERASWGSLPLWRAEAAPGVTVEILDLIDRREAVVRRDVPGLRGISVCTSVKLPFDREAALPALLRQLAVALEPVCANGCDLAAGVHGPTCGQCDTGTESDLDQALRRDC